jgi:replicative superfamily II helicase
MRTLHEIKAAAASLPVEQRSELAAWLSASSDVSEMRQAQLRREIQIGLDELARGEDAPLDMSEIKAEARACWAAERRD